MTKDRPLSAAFVDLIFIGLRDKHWLYWPPGPMTGQVFDHDKCQKDVEQLLGPFTARLVQAEQELKDNGNDYIESVHDLQIRLTKAEQERDALKDKILPKWREYPWADMRVFLLTAEANREDTETIDAEDAETGDSTDESLTRARGKLRAKAYVQGCADTLAQVTTLIENYETTLERSAYEAAAFNDEALCDRFKLRADCARRILNQLK